MTDGRVRRYVGLSYRYLAAMYEASDARLPSPEMRFPAPLIKGRLIRRYQRFLADVELGGGDVATAHCPNPGSMQGLAEPGLEVWLSRAANPARKLRYTWELVRAGRHLVGINSSTPNTLAVEAIEQGWIPELSGYAELRREVRYGTRSRVDVLLDHPAKPRCYVEVKNVHLKRRPGLAEFPDAVTTRGTKHLGELAKVAAAGERAVMLYLVQRGDCDRFAAAGDIDPAYATALVAARAGGVEALAYACKVSSWAIRVDRPLPLDRA